MKYLKKNPETSLKDYGLLVVPSCKSEGFCVPINITYPRHNYTSYFSHNNLINFV